MFFNINLYLCKFQLKICSVVVMPSESGMQNTLTGRVPSTVARQWMLLWQNFVPTDVENNLNHIQIYIHFMSYHKFASRVKWNTDTLRCLDRNAIGVADPYVVSPNVL